MRRRSQAYGLGRQTYQSVIPVRRAMMECDPDRHRTIPARIRADEATRTNKLLTANRCRYFITWVSDWDVDGLGRTPSTGFTAKNV